MLRVLNVVYPVFIFAMLVFACVAQVVTCFSRTQVSVGGPGKATNERVGEESQYLAILFLLFTTFKMTFCLCFF